jgi:lysophospholipase L1-like esterase
MLENTIYRLKKEKQLRIGYFGGSITEGAGATEWDKTSWRARLTAHLREAYPDAEITEIMAAVGGTGTDLGICRCEHDLLSGDPDLVFIEFATNDYPFEYRDQLNGYENCLRQILTYKDTVDIVCVFSATMGTEKQIIENGNFGSRSVQATLASHYGLPTVDPGDALRFAVAAAGGDWLRYTTDNTHPNDEGYSIYTDVMVKAMTRWLDGETPSALNSRAIPEPLSRESLVAGRMIDLCECADVLGEFTYNDRRFKRRFPHFWTANGVGSTIRYTFEGTAFGVYAIMDDESGILDVTIDGETRSLCLWDEYCKSFSRGGYLFAFKDLPQALHSVELRVSDKKHPESKGNKISIYAFLLL